MTLSSAGEIVRESWFEIPAHFENVELGESVIMPNHLHGLICILDNPRKTDFMKRDEVTSSLTIQPASNVGRFPTLGQIVAFFKYRSTKLINSNRETPGARFWQRNYHERIINGHDDLIRVRDYIANNIRKWPGDEAIV